ncbi:MAG: cobalamin B12-binding domain-containing protein [Steroidobacteraceae bacterium]
MDEPSLAQRDVLAAVDRYDALGCSAVLDSLTHRLPAEVLATEVLAPLLHEAGDRWRRGQYTIVQEHLLSSAILRLLSAELDRHNRQNDASKPLVAFTTLSGDRHGMGALIAAVIAASHGVNALHLGADLPVEELVVLAKEVQLRAVALSIVAEPDVIDALGQVRTLRARLPGEVEIWLGGIGSRRMDPTALPVATSLIGPLTQYLEKLSALTTSGDA